jgi:protein O-GlcNAc transferase
MNKPMNRHQRRGAARRGQAGAIQQNGHILAYNHGLALHKLGRLDEAVASYGRAIALRPDFAEAYSNRGVALRNLRRFDDAVADFDHAIALQPGLADVYYNRGIALQNLDRLDQALASYDRAIALKPDFAEALSNRGNIFRELRRLDDALASYDRAIALRPNFVEALIGRGVILDELGRFDEALTNYDRAIALKPDFAEALTNRGNIFQRLRRFDKALESYERALVVRPGYTEALAGSLLVKRQFCDWSGHHEGEWKVRSTSELQPSHRVLWTLLTLSSTLEEQIACARRVAAKISASANICPLAEHRSGERVRLGYLSADFRSHPVAFLIAGLIERHNRQRFEVFGYSCGPEDGSAIRARLTAAFDHFVDLRDTSDRQAAERIHADAIDILVDLTGYTEHCRTAILAHRPAPIQVNYLGYPGTMGADFVDYIIVDRFLVPMEQQPFYTERLVQLPNCYQPCEIGQEVVDRTPSRAECGLPEDGFVFCCFNASYKLTPTVFDVWMRLLNALPRSVLWLIAGNPLVKDNLRRKAIDCGVAAERLVFAEPTSRPEYLARLGLADLFLDTLPYNAGATASDALSAGLPVLTCSGETYVGRMAGAVLTAAGLPELVTTSLKSYEALGLRLATEPGLLAPLRQRLVSDRSTMPLFNIARFTCDLEAAYQQMCETWKAGQPPRAFSVSPLHSMRPTARHLDKSPTSKSDPIQAPAAITAWLRRLIPFS